MLVILTDHSLFKKIDLQKVKHLMNSQPLIVDGRFIINPIKARELGFIYCGVGRPNEDFDDLYQSAKSERKLSEKMVC